jgi:hypothetical protein
VGLYGPISRVALRPITKCWSRLTLGSKGVT